MSASVIRIKRSGVAGNPSTLANGELAYSALANNDANGGDRLYIGFGAETNGNAANHFVIGGKYFTDLMDHTRGTLTADSAILVDGDKKVNELFVDNLGFDGNTISSTNTNGDIFITPDGDGKVKLANLEVDGEDIQALLDSVSVGNLSIEGTADIGVDVDTAGTGFTISLEDTTVNADTYGSSTQIPVVTVDAKGRITNVTTESISTDLGLAGDTGSETIEFLTDSLTLNTGTNAGISTEVTKAGNVVTATVSLDQDLSTGGSPTFVDTTLTGDLAVNGGDLTTTDTTFNLVNANAATVNAFGDATTVSIGAGTGTTTVNNDLVVDGDAAVDGGSLTTSASTFNMVNTNATTVNAFGAATTVSIGAETGTTTVNNDLEVSGDLTVKGNVTSLETITLQVDDPLVKFGKGNPADLFSIGFYGEYTSNSTTKKTGLFRSHNTKEFFLFDDLEGDISTDNIVDTDGISLAALNIDDLTANNVVAGGNISGDQINATLFVGELDGGTY